MPKVIADTSPIQYLYQTNLLDLLPQLYGTVIVPQAVANELAAGTALQISLPNLTSLSWLKIKTTTVDLALQEIKGLGAGEKEAFALALQIKDSLMIVDDGLARYYAKQLNIKLTGTLGILLKAKQLGLLATVTPILDPLDTLGFRLDSSTRIAVLKLAQE
jgi:predicted nucleic acid-binding protein